MATRTDLADLFRSAEVLRVPDPNLAAMHVVEITEEVEALGKALSGVPEDAESLCATLGVKLLHINDHWRALRQLCGLEEMWAELEEVRPDDE